MDIGADCKDFFIKLQKNDWFYEFSDCHRTWSKGKVDNASLSELSKTDITFRRMYLSFSRDMYLRVNGKLQHTDPMPTIEESVSYLCGVYDGDDVDELHKVHYEVLFDRGQESK